MIIISLPIKNPNRIYSMIQEAKFAAVLCKDLAVAISHWVRGPLSLTLKANRLNTTLPNKNKIKPKTGRFANNPGERRLEEVFLLNTLPGTPSLTLPFVAI